MSQFDPDLVIHFATVLGITSILGLLSVAIFVAVTFDSHEEATPPDKRGNIVNEWSISHTGIATALTLAILMIIASGAMLDVACGTMGGREKHEPACTTQPNQRNHRNPLSVISLVISNS